MSVLEKTFFTLLLPIIAILIVFNTPDPNLGYFRLLEEYWAMFCFGDWDSYCDKYRSRV